MAGSDRGRACILSLIAALALAGHPLHAGGAGLARRCQMGCGELIGRCIAAGGKRARCRRLILGRCRRHNLEVCAVPTTTTTTTTLQRLGEITTTTTTSTTLAPLGVPRRVSRTVASGGTITMVTLTVGESSMSLGYVVQTGKSFICYTDLRIAQAGLRMHATRFPEFLDSAHFLVSFDGGFDGCGVVSAGSSVTIGVRSLPPWFHVHDAFSFFWGETDLAVPAG